MYVYCITSCVQCLFTVRTLCTVCSALVYIIRLEQWVFVTFKKFGRHCSTFPFYGILLHMYEPVWMFHSINQFPYLNIILRHRPLYRTLLAWLHSTHGTCTKVRRPIYHHLWNGTYPVILYKHSSLHTVHMEYDKPVWMFDSINKIPRLLSIFPSIIGYTVYHCMITQHPRHLYQGT